MYHLICYRSFEFGRYVVTTDELTDYIMSVNYVLLVIQYDDRNNIVNVYNPND
jgi:hypothetical protein